MKKILVISVFIILIFCSLCFTGCASASKEGSSLLRITDGFTYSYDDTLNITRVIFNVEIQNNSIYDIKHEKIKFELYSNNTLVDTKDYNWHIDVKNGKSNSTRCKIEYEGKIDKVEYISWGCEYNSIWETYFGWFIGAIVVAGILVIIFTIIIIANDLELYDIVDFFEDNFWFIFCILIPFIPYVITGFIYNNWSWFPPIIIIGALVAVVVIVLFVLLIKFIIQSIIDSIDSRYLYNNSCEPNNLENVENTLNESDENDDVKTELLQLSKTELVNYCRGKGIRGYSNLNKEELVNLIIENNEENPPEEKAHNDTKGKITFKDIAGLEDAKKAFEEKVVLPIKHKELYEKFGKKTGGGILLYGLPGTGKTMFAEAASNEIDALFIPIRCSDIKSKWYGESEQNIEKIFNKARKAKRAIIFFDEFEAIGAKRTDDGDNGNNDLVPEILAQMQGVGASSTNADIMVIAATNKPWAIDSAFLRPGRFDEKIYIPLPDFEARKMMIENQLLKLPHEIDLDFDLLAKLTEGCNGADIKEVCEKLKMSAIHDSIATGLEQTIGMDDVEKVKNSIKSSVQYEDIVRMEEFSKE